MQKPRVYADSAVTEAKVWHIPSARTMQQQNFLLPNRQAEDNCDKTLHSLMPDHFNVAMTKKTAKPRAALKRMENP